VQSSGHRLVITPESQHQLRPLVRAILDRAPTLEGWEFYEHRLAEDLRSALEMAEVRAKRDASDFLVRVARGAKHLVDLTYVAPSISGEDDGSARNAAFVITETLLGEACLDEWIGAIDVAPVPQPSGIARLIGRRPEGLQGAVPLSRAAETVRAVIGSIVDQLPGTPHLDWVDDAMWSLWKMQPEEADDYRAQSDLFVARSANSELWTAAHSGYLFSSRRFSRCGETFCYVKLDGAEGLDETQFADKAEIEDAMDDLLKPAGLGCTIGGGTGLRYSYVDLALTDVDSGIAAIRERLRAGNVPMRSWVQFFDSDLAAEWVGVYDETPPPPMDFADA
jgi:hypothetical protein